jgi:putative transposase
VTRSNGLREPYEASVRPSVGSVGDAYDDDALWESFFATLEFELLDRCASPRRPGRAPGIFDFIEGWYKPRRRHSGLDYLSPMGHETRVLLRV